jgi:hypothetical protein
MLSLNKTAEEELLNIFKLFSIKKDVEIQYRAYYDDTGKILLYSVDDLPGKYIVITKEQFLERRMDAIVKNGKLIATHYRSHVSKLEKSSSGTKCSKYDVTIICDDSDGQHQYWKQVIYDIRK